jgi:hypothetical protein
LFPSLLFHHFLHKQNGDTGKTANNFHIFASEHTPRISLCVRVCHSILCLPIRFLEIQYFAGLQWDSGEGRRIWNRITCFRTTEPFCFPGLIEDFPVN